MISVAASNTVTTDIAAFLASDFLSTRLVGLWDSTGTTFKGVAWVRRLVSASTLELQTPMFDPATGISAIQVVGDIVLVSKNFTESVAPGFSVSGRTVTITDVGECIFGDATATGVCFYDESKEITTPGRIRASGGLTVLGKLDNYADNSVSSPCDILFSTGGGTTVLNSGTSNSNFMMYGGVLSGPNSPLYIGGYQGTAGRTMVFNGVQNPFDFISPGAGGAWGVNASRQQLINCYSLTTSVNAIMRRWGDGLISGGRYKFPNFSAGPISVFGSDSLGTFTVATGPGSRSIVLDAGNGPALVRSNNGGATNFNFTNLITTDFRNVTGVSGALVANNGGINTFSFSETFTGLQPASVGVVVDSSGNTVQSNASTAGAWSPVMLRRTCVGATVTINSTGWTFGFKNYGRQAVSGSISPSTYDLGSAGQADNVVFGGVVTQLVDSFVTLSNAAALALSSKFTPSSTANGAVTVTASATLDELYDHLVAWGASSVALARFPSLSAYPIAAAGDQITTAMTVTVNAGVTLSGGAKFKKLSVSALTVAGTITGFEVVGNVTQVTPASLTNVSITGTLTYNAAVNASVTFTNSTLATVNNSGAGIVTVKRVNSTLTPGTNVTAYVPTVLVFTLNGGRVRVLNHIGVEQFNQTADGTFELPATATGTWSYKVAKYGSKPIEATFAINGTTITSSPAYIPDPVVFDTLANVSAYLALETTQKVYDYYSLYLASAAGILLTKSITLTATGMDLGAYKIQNSALGIAGTTIGTNSATVSGVNILTTATQAGITPVFPQQITDAVGSTNWLNITLTAGQVCRDTFTNAFATTSSITFLPATATSSITIYVTKRGFKKQVFAIPYTVTLLAAQAFTLIPDTNVIDPSSDLSAATFTSSQAIYDAFSQYQATAAGILDTYTPVKTPGAIDFVAKGVSLAASSNFGASPVQVKSAALTSDTYYSQAAFAQGAATLANSVLLRASNLNSEIVFTPDSVTFYPSLAARDTGTTPGITVTGGVYRFLHGSNVSGVVMSGTVYVRVQVGVVMFLSEIPIVSGANVLDLGVQGQLTVLSGKMDAKPNRGEVSGLIWDTAIDGTITAKRVLATTASALAGKATGGGTDTIILRNLSDTANAITMTVDVSGNRSAVTIAP